MKKLRFAVILTVALTGSMFGSTTDQLKITSGATTVTVVDNFVGDQDAANGSIVYTNPYLNGWDVEVTFTFTSSPSHQPGIEASTDASCAVSSCFGSGLDVQYSDINFYFPENGRNDYSAIVDGSGSTAQVAWFDKSNTIFGRDTFIGTVGPFDTTSSGFLIGTAAHSSFYSMTLEQQFFASGPVTFNVDGKVSMVPEPGTVVLFGTALALCAAGLWRHKLTERPSSAK